MRHTAIGLNYVGTYFRSDLYPTPLPSGLGTEAAGIVEEVGSHRWGPLQKATSEMYAICNSSWGEFMHRLRDYAEGKNPGPHWQQ